MKKIKLICSDIDGTLNIPRTLKYDFFNKKTIESIKEFISKGGEFVLATGRSLSKVQRTANVLEKKLNYKIKYLIAFNGGIVFDNIEKKIVFEQNFDDQMQANVCSYLHNHPKNLSYFVIENNTDIFMRDRKFMKFIGWFWFNKYPRKFFTEETKFKNIKKIIVISRKPNSFQLKDDIESKFENVYVACSGKNLIEVIDKSVNKFNALKKVSELLKIDLSETCSIGNESNDVEMLENSAFGVAVNFHKSKHIHYHENMIELHVKNCFGLAVHRAISHLKEKNLI